MNKLRQPMSEGSSCISGIHKVRFTPANGTIVDIMSVSFNDYFRQRNASSYNRGMESGA